MVNKQGASGFEPTDEEIDKYIKSNAGHYFIMHLCIEDTAKLVDYLCFTMDNCVKKNASLRNIEARNAMDDYREHLCYLIDYAERFNSKYGKNDTGFEKFKEIEKRKEKIDNILDKNKD
jgi:hypothetical protein